MKRLFCDCGSEVYFTNKFCNACGDSLGFIPEQLLFINPFEKPGYRLCQQYDLLDCNWLVKDTDANLQCCSCRLTRTIPDLGINNNVARWAKLEATKRRAFYMLLRLGLKIPDRNTESLLFDFLEDKRSNPGIFLEHVYTGHTNGIITINIAEADDSYLLETQELMNEAYRTLLGHFRHELGHFYWLQLKDKPDVLEAFRQLFGDERGDYASILEQFYETGATANWQEQYISSYASSHPLEDWAECWAHYFHISETLETAHAYGLIDHEALVESFHNWLSTWMQFSIALNALNRSMGTNDPYPFVINQAVKRKLYFIDCWIKGTIITSQFV
jgi:hypothetical protein